MDNSSLTELIVIALLNLLEERILHDSQQGKLAIFNSNVIDSQIRSYDLDHMIADFIIFMLDWLR